jgi:hypothetical protein
MGTIIKKLNKISNVNDKKCKKCEEICNAIHFQRDFVNWTSGNNNVDKFIQEIQLSTHSDDKYENGYLMTD